MMITFSTSAMLWVLPGSGRFTLYSTDWRTGVTPGRPLFLPARDRPSQLEVGHRPRDRRKVEGEQAVGEHRHDDRVLGLAAERDERADHPTVDAADAARQGQQVGEHADEVAHHDHGPRRRLAERLERRPQ